MPFVDLDGTRLFYQYDGRPDLPVLVLSNSLGTDHGMWDPQMAKLAHRFRVLRYDSRGHGRSDAPEGPYTIDRLGQDALSLLDRLGHARVVFCGLSKGGMVGMWIATHASERVERLVLCNTSARIGAPEAWNQRIEAVRRDGMAAIAPGVLERWFTAGYRRRAPESVERSARMLLATPPQGYIACCAAVRDMDQSKAIAAIRAPTLIIAGTQDAATPPDHAQAIVARIAGARLVSLDAAHLSNIEQAEAFNAAVAEFLDEGEGGRT